MRQRLFSLSLSFSIPLSVSLDIVLERRLEGTHLPKEADEVANKLHPLSGHRTITNSLLHRKHHIYCACVLWAVLYGWGFPKRIANVWTLFTNSAWLFPTFHCRLALRIWIYGGSLENSLGGLHRAAAGRSSRVIPWRQTRGVADAEYVDRGTLGPTV